jgi:hypothetical protein
MKVRCLRDSIDDAMAAELGLGRYAPRLFNSTIVVGSEYVVLGITCGPKSEAFGSSPTVLIRDERGGCAFVHLALFEITEDSASRFWKVVSTKNGTLKIWPKSFFKQYYHDDLSEGVPEIVEDFRKVADMIKSEAETASGVSSLHISQVDFAITDPTDH